MYTYTGIKYLFLRQQKKPLDVIQQRIFIYATQETKNKSIQEANAEEQKAEVCRSAALWQTERGETWK